MRLRGKVSVAEQSVGCRFSSLELRNKAPMTCNLNLFTLFFHYFLLDLFLIIIISSKVRYPLKINQIKILNGFSFSIIRF